MHVNDICSSSTIHRRLLASVEIEDLLCRAMSTPDGCYPIFPNSEAGGLTCREREGMDDPDVGEGVNIQFVDLSALRRLGRGWDSDEHLSVIELRLLKASRGIVERELLVHLVRPQVDEGQIRVVLLIRIGNDQVATADGHFISPAGPSGKDIPHEPACPLVENQDMGVVIAGKELVAGKSESVGAIQGVIPLVTVSNPSKLTGTYPVDVPSLRIDDGDLFVRIIGQIVHISLWIDDRCIVTPPVLLRISRHRDVEAGLELICLRSNMMCFHMCVGNVCIGDWKPCRSHDDQTHSQQSENKSPRAVNYPSESHNTPP